MDLRQLRYFLAVAEHDGINAAARSLSVAQPTVSQAITSLERRLGVALFHRLGGRMVLTSAGWNLLGPARRINRDVAVAERVVRPHQDEVAGSLDVVAISPLAGGALAGYIGRFCGQYPNVTVHLDELADEDAAAGVVREGRCELAVSYMPVTDQRELTAVELGRQEYWAVYPPGTPQPVRSPVAWADLPDLPLVIAPRGVSTATEIEASIARAGRHRPPAAIVHHREARVPLVLAGVGGTFIDHAPARDAAEQGAVVFRVTPAVSHPFGLVYDPRHLSPAARAFVAMVEQDQ